MDIFLTVVGIFICIVLQICVCKTTETKKLTVCIVVTVISLVIQVFSSLIFLPIVLLISAQIPGMGLYLVIKIGMIIWHICLIVSAHKRKQKIFNEADVVQVVYCNACGAASPEGSQFCRKCGKMIEEKEIEL